MTIFDKKEIPQEISIFPLANAVFFPNTILPLNIWKWKILLITIHRKKIMN